MQINLIGEIFSFFNEFPSKWDNSSEDLRYPDLISQSDTTIRAVDNQYMYIYTTHKTIISAVEKKYVIESITNDILENLEYPF